MHIPIIGGLLGQKKEEETDFDIPAPPQNVDINGMVSQGYGEPYFRFQQDNQQIESKLDLLRFIQNANLTVNCKDALTYLVLTYYDKNVMLSNLRDKNGEDIAYYYMLITIKMVTLNASDRSDITRPEFITVINLLQRQVQFELSRTWGGKNERAWSGMITMGIEGIQRISKIGKGEQERRE